MRFERLSGHQQRDNLRAGKGKEGKNLAKVDLATWGGREGSMEAGSKIIQRKWRDRREGRCRVRKEPGIRLPGRGKARYGVVRLTTKAAANRIILWKNGKG